ncbi:Alpha/Beta hydrolase protein [Pelagophyceae sp. CCMP2097]|nr:Alpha/Beta hydrolase protein [Pelagophyceae sp. CCMP2097]
MRWLARVAAAVAVAAALSPVRERVAVTERFVDVGGGQILQPPVIFVHGTFHSAWCWSERWLPRFSEAHGLEVHALSLRGTSPSPCADAKVTVRQHADDVLAATEALLGSDWRASFVAHSFGGPVLFDLLDRRHFRANAQSVSLLCSVPPSGNGGMTRRVVFRSPIDAFRITRAFAMKTACSDIQDAQRVFFGGQLEEGTCLQYMAKFKADSTVGLDLGDYMRTLPTPEKGGRARWLAEDDLPKISVFGAELDFIVDEEAVLETANFVGAEARFFPAAPHDVMLCDDDDAMADAVARAL